MGGECQIRSTSALSLHGWIALGLGSSLSLLIGGGLMGLMFHSARKGYDERIGGNQNHENPVNHVYVQVEHKLIDLPHGQNQVRRRALPNAL